MRLSSAKVIVAIDFANLHKGDSADVKIANYSTCFIPYFCRGQSNLLCNELVKRHADQTLLTASS